MKKVPAAKMPNLNHLSTSDFERVYEPADDTFLLVDALAAERDLLVARKPALCVEIGCGSGAVITHLASLLPDSAMLASDVNRWALLATAATASANSRRVSTVQADLLSAFRPGSIDVLIFNPPYVPTPDEELAEAERTANISAAWAGGDRGRRVIDRLLPTLGAALAPCGIFYLLGVAENDPTEIAELLRDQHGFNSRLIAERRAQNERLFVMAFERSHA
jgi:release factor glutamine methyltransferase